MKKNHNQLPVITPGDVAQSERLRKIASEASDPSVVRGATRMSIPDVERRLLEAKRTAEIVNPGGQGANVVAWAQRALEQIHTDDWLKSKGEVALAASQGDEQAKSTYAKSVVLTTRNLLMVDCATLPFFRYESLAQDEAPVVNPQIYGQALKVETIGADGGAMMIQAQPKNQQPIHIPLNIQSTPWIEYPLKDAYKGETVKSAALAQFDIPRDRMWRLDALISGYVLHGAPLSRLVDTFTTTGNDWDRDYITHPRVNVANLPVGNYIVAPGNTTTSPFRKAVFDAILQYCSAWGVGSLEEGDIHPIEIQIASKHVTDFLGQVDINNYVNPLSDQIFRGGMVVNYANVNWIIRGNNTLDPNLGMAYVRTTREIGVYYDKPDLEELIVDESAGLRQTNKGRVSQQFAEGIALPISWRKNMIGVRYRTPV